MTQTVIQEVAKGKHLTEKQEALLNNVRKGLHPKKAALKAGYSASSVYAAIRGLKNEIVELSELALIQYGPEAAKVHGDILTAKKPIPQANVKLSASQSILDRIGLGKKDSLKVEHEVRGGIFLIPSKVPLEEKVINE